MDNSLLAKFVGQNLDFVIDNIVSEINKDYVRTAITEVLERVKLTVQILTDDNPDNKAQLELLWGSVLADENVTNAMRAALLDAVSRIDDQKIKDALTLLVPPLVQTVIAVSDKTPNKDQLKQIWVNFVESPEFIAFVISNLNWILSKIIKDQNTLNFVNRILQAFIK